MNDRKSPKNINQKIDDDASSSKESIKKEAREKNELPDIKIKVKSEYQRDPDLIKAKGTKAGGWFYRSDPSLSKQSRWLFKDGGGYASLATIFDVSSSVISEISAVKEAYAGELYSLLAEDHVPKSRLVVNNNKNNLPRFIISSKRISNFEDLKEIRKKGLKIEKNFLLKNMENK